MTTRLAVKARAISKSYRSGKSSLRALSDFSLDIFSGEYCAVMGPSGSGKSTLLHLLGGLISPDTGTLEIAGQSVGHLTDARLTEFRRDYLGIIFQSYNLLPTLSTEQNIALPRLARGRSAMPEGRELPELKAYVQHLLELTGLQERGSHRPAALSGGEQQRVAIARALINNPGLILADEPTGNLDSRNARRICELFARLHGEHGKTILMVTHDPIIAHQAQRVLILKDGELLDDQPTARFGDASELAAHFLAAISGKTAHSPLP